MADYFVWDRATLSVAVKEMDDEHEELIRRMNALHAAHMRGASPSELSERVESLVEYTQKHFADEEAYMERIGYAGLSSHKLMHQALLTKVGQHVAEFERSGGLTREFFFFLSFWLKSHICGIDAKYGNAAAA